MKVTWLIVAALLTSAFAQEWIDIYTDSGSTSYLGQDILVDAQGNVYACGGSGERDLGDTGTQY
jgi:sulfatase maturation enzyme AslB (radical SAM superfamily)